MPSKAPVVWRQAHGQNIAATPATQAHGSVKGRPSFFLWGSCYALDGRTGVKKWEASPSSERFVSPMVGADETVYVCSGGDGLSALAASPWPKFQGNAANTGNVRAWVSGPSLSEPPNPIIEELTPWRVTLTVVGLEPRTNSLSYALVSGPEGAQLDEATGILAWIPAEAQGPGTYGIIVKASDQGVPPLSVTNHFTVMVSEVNTAPSLAVPPTQVVDEGVSLTVTNLAMDPDRLANTMTFHLLSGPEGVHLDPATGILTWAPTEAQGPSTNEIVLTVTDNGIPSLSSTNRFTVVVNEVNQASRLTVPPSQTIEGFSTLVVTNFATDGDTVATGRTMGN